MVMLGVSTRRRCTTIPSLLCRANVHVGLGQLKVLAAFREKSLISHSPKHGTSISFHLPPESSAIRPWFKPLHSAARLFNTSTSQAPLTEEVRGGTARSRFPTLTLVSGSPHIRTSLCPSKIARTYFMCPLFPKSKPFSLQQLHLLLHPNSFL